MNNTYKNADAIAEVIAFEEEGVLFRELSIKKQSKYRRLSRRALQLQGELQQEKIKVQVESVFDKIKAGISDAR